MGFKCGIAGLPNVGKSTLFSALTNCQINIDNYPFCTIEPNIGMVSVPDLRLQKLAEIVKPQRIVPATIEFVDIAGLVEGASQGEGLGNKFLSHIRETHAIAQVVRCFDDDNIIHVSGKVDPLADIEIINTELCLADQDSLERALKKTAKIHDQTVRRQRLIFEKAMAHLDQAQAIRCMPLNEQESNDLQTLNLLTQKPMLYIANVNDEEIFSDPWLEKLTQLATIENAMVIPISIATELEIAGLDEDIKKELLDVMGVAEHGLNRVIHAGYELLNMHTYFTAGSKEVRAWTLNQGDNAKRAAAIIHTDFGKGFIRAEVIAYADFIAYQGEQGAKDAGKWRLEGKDYIVCDGDIMHFRTKV